MIQIGLYPHKCKQCGKRFEARREYAYKLPKFHRTDDYDWFCSYKHLRQYEQEHSLKEKLTAREVEAINLMEQGLKTMEIATRMGVSRNRVLAIKDKWEDINYREGKSHG